MKLRVIQWNDTKRFQIQKKHWWQTRWERLEYGLFSWEELCTWDLRDNNFHSEHDVWSFLLRFSRKGRMAWVTNEISPVVIKPFNVKDIEKLYKEKYNDEAA